MNKRTIKLWNSLKNNIRYKYPEEIKIILNICGFDSELSLKEINEATIKSIEEQVNQSFAQNNADIVSALSNSSYKDKPLPFEFLLGHRLLILSIAKTIDSIKEDKTRKSLGKSLDNLQNEPEESEADHSPIVIDELKQSLARKFQAYAKKHKLNFEINENHINKFSRKKGVTFCVVKCCFCETKRSCKFTTNWEISNITSHIRSIHSSAISEKFGETANEKVSEQIQVDQITLKSTTENTTPNLTQNLAQNSLENNTSIQRARSNVMQEVAKNIE